MAWFVFLLSFDRWLGLYFNGLLIEVHGHRDRCVMGVLLSIEHYNIVL